MLAATILAATLSTVPPAAVPPASQLTRAEFERSPSSVHVLAFDANEDVAAEVILWRVDQRHLRIDALFPDGILLTAVFDGDSITTLDNDEPEVVAARLAAVIDLLASASVSQANWTKCAGYAAFAAWELSHASPIGVVGAVLAACECLPEIIDEFEGMECF
jgi:hypothetical protein